MFFHQKKIVKKANYLYKNTFYEKKIFIHGTFLLINVNLNLTAQIVCKIKTKEGKLRVGLKLVPRFPIQNKSPVNTLPKDCSGNANFTVISA